MDYAYGAAVFVYVYVGWFVMYTQQYRLYVGHVNFSRSFIVDVFLCVYVIYLDSRNFVFACLFACLLLFVCLR